MNAAELVKAYYRALDAGEWDRMDEFLTEDYRLEGFQAHAMGRQEMVNMIKMFRTGIPNLEHSISNISYDGDLVRLTVQRSGVNSAPLDLRPIGLGVVPRSQKFIIFPNATYELTLRDGKIAIERDVSPSSINRRLSGMLKAVGVSDPSA